MGLKYYSHEVNNSDEYPPLYTNTSVLYHKRNQSPSQSSDLRKNIYANISLLSPKPIDTFNESSYVTLMNTTSTALDENNNKRIYENLNLRSSSTNPDPKTSIDKINLSSSLPIYINLDDLKDPQTTSSKNYQKKKIQNSSIDHETNILEANTIQTVKRLEINMAPNCGDKSILYRTKLPTTITQIRRTSYRARRHRRRSSTPFRTTHHRRQQHSLHKTSHMKSVSNQLYTLVQPTILLHADEELFECPMQFQGILQHQIISWYPTENNNEEELIPQVFSASENGESNQQDETTTDEEEEKEGEELFPHDTFEDFLLRRPTKSSSSDTNSIISKTTSHEIPTPPPRPAPLTRRLPGSSLALDKTDVDFIHNIIQRTHGEDRVSNRITALREAYLRAESKRNELQQTKKKMPIKHSFITSKIRHELEKYDELPIHQRAYSYDDDDDTYSANDDHRFYRRTLPPVPSTTHRIISFLTTLKRQLQKNFQEIRSRILIEAMASPSTRHRHPFHDSSGPSHRHMSRSKTPHNTSNHHSTEHSYPLHRIHSNTSQLQSYRPRTFRVTPHQQRQQRIA